VSFIFFLLCVFDVKKISGQAYRAACAFSDRSLHLGVVFFVKALSAFDSKPTCTSYKRLGILSPRRWAILPRLLYMNGGKYFSLQLVFFNNYIAFG